MRYLGNFWEDNNYSIMRIIDEWFIVTLLGVPIIYACLIRYTNKNENYYFYMYLFALYGKFFMNYI